LTRYKTEFPIPAAKPNISKMIETEKRYRPDDNFLHHRLLAARKPLCNADRRQLDCNVSSSCESLAMSVRNETDELRPTEFTERSGVFP
jgi:hypothetical protein